MGILGKIGTAIMAVSAIVIVVAACSLWKEKHNGD